jgi:hypothetical protein
MQRWVSAIRGWFAENKDVIGAILVFGLMLFLWAPDAILGTGVYWHNDLRHHHYPWRVWAANEWLSGRIPLWCSGVANGYPLMADGQVGALYPPTMLLFMLLPSAWAMNLSILLHSLWAALGTFLLVRALGRSVLASILAGVGYAFGGFFVAHTLYLGMQNALAWLPFTLWALIRATSPNPGGVCRWAWVVLGLCMMMLAGHPQAAVYGWLLTGGLFLWRVHPVWKNPRLLVTFAMSVILAAALAAPQILATLELTRFSMRSGGVSEIFAETGSMPPLEFINAVLPRFFGFERPADAPVTYGHEASGYWGAANHWDMAFYFGIPIVVLATRRIFDRSRRFWLCVAFLACVMMLGKYTPVYTIVRHLPGLGYFRFPSRFAMWLALAVPVLAAFGFDDLMDDLRKGRVARRWLLSVGLVSLIGFIGFIGIHVLSTTGAGFVEARLMAKFMSKVQVSQEVPPDLSPLIPGGGGTAEHEDPALIQAKVNRILTTIQNATSPLSFDVLWPMSLVGLLLGGYLYARRHESIHHLFGAGIIALLALDLYLFFGDYNPRVDRAKVEAPPAAMAVMDGNPRDYRVAVVDRVIPTEFDQELASANLGLLWGWNDVIVPSPLRIVRNDAYLARVGLDIGYDRGRVKVDRLLNHLPLASVLGVRYLFSVHRIEDPRLRLLQERPVRVYENTQALPLAHLVGCVREAASPVIAFTSLDGLRTEHEAIVEPGDTPISPELTGCTTGFQGNASIMFHDARRWQVTVDSPRAALLVVAESYYPGWQATVDGLSAPIFKTDFILKGIPVPAGRHVVELRYCPDWLVGALASAAAAFVVVGLLWALGLFRMIARHSHRA